MSKQNMRQGMAFVGLSLLSYILLRTSPAVACMVIPILPFVFVLTFRFCKRNESVCIFLAVIMTFTMPNIVIARSFAAEWLYFGDIVLLAKLYIILVWAILFSIEEIVYLSIARLLYRKQNRPL